MLSFFFFFLKEIPMLLSYFLYPLTSKQRGKEDSFFSESSVGLSLSRSF